MGSCSRANKKWIIRIRKIRAYLRKGTMSTRSVKSMIARMKLIYEAVGVVVANDFQGLITIDDFSQFNYKYVEGIFWVL